MVGMRSAFEVQAEHVVDGEGALVVDLVHQLLSRAVGHLRVHHGLDIDTKFAK